MPRKPGRPKTCDRCRELGRQGKRVPGYRFCHICIGVMKRAMRRDGYLEYSPEEKRAMHNDS